MENEKNKNYFFGDGMQFWIGRIIPFEQQRSLVSGDSWGYRYKVRLLGDYSEVDNVEDKNVYTAQVLVPPTAGTGGGGWLFDTERGYNKFIRSSDNYAEGTETTMVSGFTNTGFSLDGDGGQSDNTNNNGADYVSWNFRKAPGFFDVVTYNGNATNRTIPHSLGCVPGCILIKRTDVATDWMVYHRGLNGGNSPSANRLHLNTAVVEAAASTVFNETEPTSTEFSIGTHYDVNGNNGTFPPINDQYFIDNSLSLDTIASADGLTTIFTAKALVQCNETYHIRLAIGDGTDGLLDSYVWLEAGSFSSPILDVVASCSTCEDLLSTSM